MSASTICSSFILGSPPGELNEVINDIKTLTSDDEPDLINKLKPALQKYNEEQLVCVKLPGPATEHVVISSYNRLADGRYFDTKSKKAFHFDHLTSTVSQVQPHESESGSESTLIKSLNTALSRHFAEHYPVINNNKNSSSNTASGFSVAPTNSSSSVAILLSTTKSSPSNFLSARWRSTFIYSPSTNTLEGSIQINVHYYEDGNVALTTRKTIAETEIDGSSSTAATTTSSNAEAEAEANANAVVAKIAAIEKQHQEQVNRTFVSMNEQGFKALRRQLPVTRQKVEWEKIRGYNLSDTLKGAREV